jgi:tripartite-type tricarboxylate transporter receptor subunit TctC
MKISSIFHGTVAGVALAAGAFGVPTTATAAEFSAKKVEFIVPYQEGGGSDVYCRLFAPFLSKYLPGQPTVLLRNMPGGASVKGSNWFEANAKPDGKSLVVISSSTQVSYLLGGKKIKFDMLKWRTLLTSPLGTVVYIHPNTGFTAKDPVGSLKKIADKELRFGAKTVVASELLAFLSYEMVGLKNIKPVFGLSRGKARQAMMRNEMELNTDTAGAYIKRVVRLVEQGKVVPVMAMGFPKKGKVTRDPAFPEIPTVIELAEQVTGKKPSGPMYDAWYNFVNMAVGSAKGIALAKGTPDDIYNIYLEALKKTLADEKFKKSAEKIIGSYEQFLGADANEAFQAAVGMKPEVKKWLTDWIQKKFNVNI